MSQLAVGSDCQRLIDQQITSRIDDQVDRTRLFRAQLDRSDFGKRFDQWLKANRKDLVEITYKQGKMHPIGPNGFGIILGSKSVYWQLHELRRVFLDIGSRVELFWVNESPAGKRSRYRLAKGIFKIGSLSGDVQSSNI